MSTSFELELCQTNTTYENLQNCIGMIRKHEDNCNFVITCAEYVIIITLLVIGITLWRKTS